MFQAPFSFEGRIRRTEWGLSLIIYVAALFFMGALSQASEIFLILYIPILWFLWGQGAKRCHDVGNSGWWLLIPLYSLIIVFLDGQEGPNEYGEIPKGIGNGNFSVDEITDIGKDLEKM